LRQKGCWHLFLLGPALTRAPALAYGQKRPSRTNADHSLNPHMKPIGQLAWMSPSDTAELPNVEVEFLHVIAAATPDHRDV